MSALSLKTFRSSVQGVRSRLQETFFAWGWLVPAVLPLAQIVGRAAFNILGACYLLWAALAFDTARARGAAAVARYFWPVPMLYFLSACASPDPAASTAQFGKFAAHSGIWLLALAGIVHAGRAGLLRYTKVLGIAAVIGLTVLLARLPLQLAREDFAAARDLNEHSLPFLLPFGLYVLHLGLRGGARRFATGAWVVALAGYVIYSGGRTALLGVAAALAVYAATVWRLGMAKTLGMVAIIITTAVFFHGESIVRSAFRGEDLSATLDVASSYRTTLWRQALQHPPQNLWLGAGLGNPERDPRVFEVVTVDGIADKAKHLHNFLFDGWYETGILGAAALLGFLLILVRRALSGYAAASGPLREILGVYLAAATGILLYSLLHYSHTSAPFVIYLSLFLAIPASVRADPATDAPVGPDPHTPAFEKD